MCTSRVDRNFVGENEWHLLHLMLFAVTFVLWPNGLEYLTPTDDVKFLKEKVGIVRIRTNLTWFNLFMVVWFSLEPIFAASKNNTCFKSGQNDLKIIISLHLSK